MKMSFAPLSASFAPSFASFALFASMLVTVTTPAWSQAWPTKPIRIVVPYAAGGATDTYGRYFGQKYTEALGQQVIVENRPGAGGNVGAAVVAKATPDGYTWLLNTAGPAIAPGLYRKLSYDAAKELQPAVLLVRSIQVLVLSPGVQATNVAELVALAKAQPGKIFFGSTGIGSGPHLAGELFRSLAGVNIVHVPYKGDAPLVPALLSGEVQMSFLPSQAAMPQIKGGKLRAIAVASATRSPFLPDTPPVGDTVTGYDMTTWAGLFTTGGTPRDITQRISNEGLRMLKQPDVLKTLQTWGVEPIATGMEAFEARYKVDIEKYAKLIRDAGIPQED
jgi:tripartite-type tricarboxylate transporter receptor subunit TctC